METPKQVKIEGGYVILKPFLDRKTMRDYRKTIAHNSKNEAVIENGKTKMDKEGMPMNRLVIDPAQMDVSNDVLVRGCVAQYVSEKDPTPVTPDEAFFDSMASEDFDKILDAVVLLMKKKEKEKKS